MHVHVQGSPRIHSGLGLAHFTPTWTWTTLHRGKQAPRYGEQKGPNRLLVAIGGNATHPENIEGTSKEQEEIAKATASALLPLMLSENELVITHGNGPVVGKILMRQALTRQKIAPMSLDICVAHSQGGIAYLLLQALENALRDANNERHVACLLTQVEVDPDDPAFDNPSKPIGAFYSEEEAKKIEAELGWEMREDSGRGWRHVVHWPGGYAS